ncbi:hypothetical protein E4U52_004853 [Claviceps spartinae]|nr:hypothetical protein E4U52_004853 [Claviceps spartinae]
MEKLDGFGTRKELGGNKSGSSPLSRLTVIIRDAYQRFSKDQSSRASTSINALNTVLSGKYNLFLDTASPRYR